MDTPAVEAPADPAPVKLEIERKGTAEFPEAGYALEGDRWACRVTIDVDASGTPTRVTAADCPAEFLAATEKAVMDTRFHPLDPPRAVRVPFTVNFVRAPDDWFAGRVAVYAGVSPYGSDNAAWGPSSVEVVGAIGFTSDFASLDLLVGGRGIGAYLGAKLDLHPDWVFAPTVSTRTAAITGSYALGPYFAKALAVGLTVQPKGLFQFEAGIGVEADLSPSKGLAWRSYTYAGVSCAFIPRPEQR